MEEYDDPDSEFMSWNVFVLIFYIVLVVITS